MKVEINFEGSEIRISGLNNVCDVYAEVEKNQIESIAIDNIEHIDSDNLLDALGDDIIKEYLEDKGYRIFKA